MPPYAVPYFYLSLGQTELALDALERRLEQGFFSGFEAILSPDFQGFRANPRYQALLQKTGMVLPATR